MVGVVGRLGCWVVGLLDGWVGYWQPTPLVPIGPIHKLVAFTHFD